MSYSWKTLFRMLVIELLFNTTCHPQTDGETKVTSYTITVLLQSMVCKTLKDWDLRLAHTTFASNQLSSYITCLSLDTRTSSSLINLQAQLKPRQLIQCNPHFYKQRPISTTIWFDGFKVEDVDFVEELLTHKNSYWFHSYRSTTEILIYKCVDFKASNQLPSNLRLFWLISFVFCSSSKVAIRFPRLVHKFGVLFCYNTSNPSLMH